MRMTPWYKQKSTWAGALGVLAASVSLIPDWSSAVTALFAGLAGVLGGTGTRLQPRG